MFERKVTKDTFKMHYLNDFKGFLNLENKTEIKLMHIIWEAAWNSTSRMIHANKEIKQEWADKLGCSLGTVNNTLTKLVNKELVKVESRSIYYPNPKFFFSYAGKDQPRTITYILEGDGYII